MDWYKEFPREKFMELIASGMVEQEALDEINEGRIEKQKWREIHLVNIQVKNPKIREELEEAKKVRADVWFNGIATSVGKKIDKEEVPAEKLKFEQRKYLAAIDNPDRYSEKRKLDIDINVSIFDEMKALKGEDVAKMLKASDPFAIEAESSLVVDEEGDIFE